MEVYPGMDGMQPYLAGHFRLLSLPDPSLAHDTDVLLDRAIRPGLGVAEPVPRTSRFPYSPQKLSHLVDPLQLQGFQMGQPHCCPIWFGCTYLSLSFLRHLESIQMGQQGLSHLLSHLVVPFESPLQHWVLP